MTTTIERAAPDLRQDGRQPGGRRAHTTSAAARTPEQAVESPAELRQHTPMPDGEPDPMKADAIGDHLTPLPRSTGRAMARGRRRWRSSDRRAITLVTTLTVSLLVLGLVALVIGSRHRQRGTADQLVRQLARMPSRTPVLDG